MGTSYKDTFRPLRNVLQLVTLTETILERAAYESGMGCFSGPSGFGKTFATMYVALEYDAIHVEVTDYMTRKSLAEEIAREMGLTVARKSLNDLMVMICERLNYEPRPLLLDDAHLMATKGLPRMARHIFDKTDVPVILIGEEELPGALAKFEDVAGRIGTHWVQASPASLADVQTLSEVYAPDVTIDGDLQTAILTTAQGSLRNVSSLLGDVYRAARANGWKTVLATDFEVTTQGRQTAPPAARKHEELGRTPSALRRIA